MQPILECCCGIDVHKDMVEVCIIKGTTETTFIRKQFSTIQSDLLELVSWLFENDCFHIAMESTGVYWRPIYEAIEEFSPYYESIIVANAHHMKNRAQGTVLCVDEVVTLCYNNVILKKQRVTKCQGKQELRAKAEYIMLC